MPITKQAAKKMRRDSLMSSQNKKIRHQVQAAVKLVRRSPTAKHLERMYSVLDKAAKKHVIHQNRAARLKSRMTHLVKK